MSEHKTQAVEFPFSVRNGSNVLEQVETLLAPPEVEYSEGEKAILAEFADGLFTGSYGGVESGVARDLEVLHKTETKTHRQSYYLDYFLTEKGKTDLALIGLPEDAPVAVVAQTLIDVPRVTGLLDTKTRKQVAHRSVDWHKKALAERLLDNPSDDEAFEDYEKVEVNYKPDKLLDKIDDLRKYRRFYGKIRSQLRRESPEDRLVGAKRTLLAVHVGRVNHLLTEMYPVALSLAQQLQQSEPGEQVDAWIERLTSVAPFISEVYDADDSDERQYDLARRFDFIRNGVVYAEGLTPLGDELKAFLDQSRETEPGGALIPPDALAELDATVWDAGELKGFLEAVLEYWGELSAEQADWTIVDDREGFAADGHYQVVISPKKKNLEVLSAKRVMVVPEKFKRTLTQVYPSGVLPVAAHELAHVLQSFADQELGKMVPLAKIKGRRFITLREAGGLYQEQFMQETYFGRSRPTNPHYARALDAKLGGANKLQVIRAFYDSYVQTLDSHDQTALSEARELAADRAMRLYREAGYNTQPLDYIEQGMIVDELRDLPHDKINALIVGGSSFNLQDSAMLNRAGLLKLPESLERDAAQDVMRIFFEQGFSSLDKQVQ